jgi:hypothetical protein
LEKKNPLEQQVFLLVVTGIFKKDDVVILS